MSDRSIPPLDSLLEHRTWVRAVARRLLRDEHAAEDLAQEAWVRALRSPPDPGRDPKPWLRRVLENLAINRHRGETRRTQRETNWRDVREQRSPAELVAEAEQHRRLVGLVLDLEEPFKTALVLRFYEGLGPKAIAGRLGIPVGTVHSRIARATERLKQRLDDETHGDRKVWIAALLPLAGSERVVPAAAGTATTSLAGILLMTLTKPKFALLTVLLIGCLIGGGVYLASQSTGDQTPGARSALLSADTGGDAPTLAGRAALRSPDAPGPTTPVPAPREQADAASIWHGRVLDHESRPASGALVFSLPRGAKGIDEDALGDTRYGRQVTDADGRFTMRIGDVEAPRVIAWSETAIPASVDLSTLDAKRPLELRLGAPRTVTVRVEHQLGGGRAEVGLNLRSSEEGFDRTDDPSLQSVYYWRDEPEFGDGEAFVARLNTTAPLSADLDVPSGYTTIPRRHALRKDEETVVFRIVPSAQVRYALVDASTGSSLAPGTRTTMFLFEPGTRTVVASRDSADPSFAVTTGLPPGMYHYEFKAKGYAQVEGDILVREAGEQIEGTLRLEPEGGGAGGGLLLRVSQARDVPSELQAMARTSSKESWGFSCAVFIRRRGETWRGTHASASRDGQVQVWPAILSAAPARFEDGLYDIYVAHRETGTAALLRQVHLFPDQDNEFDVQLRPGTLIQLVGLVGKDEPLASFDVRVPEVGSVPWVEFKSWGWRTFVTSAEQGSALAAPRGARILGPFPAPLVEVRAVLKNGKQKTWRVAGAARVERR